MTLEEYETAHPACGFAVWLVEANTVYLDRIRQAVENGIDPIVALSRAAERQGAKPGMAAFGRRAVAEIWTDEFRRYLAARLGMV